MAVTKFEKGKWYKRDDNDQFGGGTVVQCKASCPRRTTATGDNVGLVYENGNIVYGWESQGVWVHNCGDPVYFDEVPNPNEPLPVTKFEKGKWYRCNRQGSNIQGMVVECLGELAPEDWATGCVTASVESSNGVVDKSDGLMALYKDDSHWGWCKPTMATEVPAPTAKAGPTLLQWKDNIEHAKGTNNFEAKFGPLGNGITAQDCRSYCRNRLSEAGYEGPLASVFLRSAGNESAGVEFYGTAHKPKTSDPKEAPEGEPRFTVPAQIAMKEAMREAQLTNDYALSTDKVLLGLTFGGGISANVLRNLDVSYCAIYDALRDRWPHHFRGKDDNGQPLSAPVPYGGSLRNILNQRQEWDTGAILSAILKEEGSFASYVASKLGLKDQDVQEEAEHLRQECGEQTTTPDTEEAPVPEPTSPPTEPYYHHVADNGDFTLEFTEPVSWTVAANWLRTKGWKSWHGISPNHGVSTVLRGVRLTKVALYKEPPMIDDDTNDPDEPLEHSAEDDTEPTELEQEVAEVKAELGSKQRALASLADVNLALTNQVNYLKAKLADPLKPGTVVWDKVTGEGPWVILDQPDQDEWGRYRVYAGTTGKGNNGNCPMGHQIRWFYHEALTPIKPKIYVAPKAQRESWSDTIITKVVLPVSCGMSGAAAALYWVVC